MSTTKSNMTDNVILRFLTQQTYYTDVDQFINVKSIIDNFGKFDPDTTTKLYNILFDDGKQELPEQVYDMISAFGVARTFKLCKERETEIHPEDVLTFGMKKYKKYHKYPLKQWLSENITLPDDFEFYIERLYELGLMNQIVEIYRCSFQARQCLNDVAHAKISNINYVKRIMQIFSIHYEHMFLIEDYDFHGFHIKVMKHLYKCHKSQIITLSPKLTLSNSDIKMIIFMKKYNIVFTHPKDINRFSLMVRKCQYESLMFIILKRVIRAFSSKNLAKLSSYFV